MSCICSAGRANSVALLGSEFRISWSFRARAVPQHRPEQKQRSCLLVRCCHGISFGLWSGHCLSSVGWQSVSRSVESLFSNFSARIVVVGLPERVRQKDGSLGWWAGVRMLLTIRCPLRVIFSVQEESRDGFPAAVLLPLFRTTAVGFSQVGGCWLLSSSVA